MTRVGHRVTGPSEREIRKPEDAGPLRLAFADPPYPGQAKLYRNHPDYAGEVDHEALVARLSEFDGWALCSGAGMLRYVLPLCPPGTRVMCWFKTRGTGIKPRLSLQYGWEPVMVYGGRRRSHHAPMLWDVLTCYPGNYRAHAGDATLIPGIKPPAFCEWVFRALGAQQGDELVDIFPGSGAVGREWERFQAQGRLIA
jgi:hypothetical protein